jgi:hypothetical protein
MSIADKEQQIKELLAKIRQSDPFESVSLTRRIQELTDDIEREKMEEKTQAASQEPDIIPD